MKWLVAILSAISFTLQGCIFVVGAATGAAALAVVYDHRSIENTLADQHITNQIARKIKAVPELYEDSHLSVTTFQQMVLLTGQTPRPEWKKQAEMIARTVPGIKKLYNQITIEGPTSSFIHASDTWITTKVKSQLLLATRSLKSSSMNVVTENGTVYLIGIVTQEQAQTAVEIARQVAGVQKVVKIFHYQK